MKQIDGIMKKIILGVFFSGLLTLSVQAEEFTDHTFKEVLIRDALQFIAARYGVTIVSDPGLTGLVNGTIRGNDLVTAAIRTVVEPLGYFFIKVENYFLVGGPESPLTVFAQTESALIPVDFISPDIRNQFSEYRQYLTFDERSGAVFIKAPASIMNQILASLWKATDNAREISILYNLLIMDLGTGAGLEGYFSGSLDSTKTQGDSWVISPGELGVDGRLSAFIQAKITRNEYRFIRRPWLITIPGKTVEIKESLRYLGDNSPNLDRSFALKITPIQVDGASGKVLSEVSIGRDEDHSSRISSSIRTNPYAYELLAVVRQAESKPAWSMLGKQRTETYRDFAVLLAAAPVNIQQTLTRPGGVIPMASLGGGVSRIVSPDPDTIQSKPELEMRFAIPGQKGVNPWVNLTVPLNPQNILQAEYRDFGHYSLGFSSEFESSDGTYLDFLAGRGIGPGDQGALMVGLGDRVRLNPHLSLFGEYYPNAYFYETNQYFGQWLWSAGANLESGNFGLTVSAFGNPDFNGWRLNIDLTESKACWFINLNTIDEDPVLSIGLGIKF